MNMIVIIMLALTLCAACGDCREICETCTSDDDCCDGATCVMSYGVLTGIPVGSYCLDSPERVCSLL